MQYRVYTKSGIVIYPVAFRCQKCGMLSSVKNPFRISAQYNDRGAWTRGGLQKRADAADDELEWQRAGLFGEITYDVGRRTVKDTGFVCDCRNCGAVPVWSRFRNPKLEALCNFLSCLGLVLAAAFCLPMLDGDYSGWYKLVLSLSVLLGGVLTPRILYQYKSSKVRALSEAYMPIVCKDDKAALLALEELRKKDPETK